MGNDGGSIPDRRDLVRSKPKAEQADRANQTRARWFFCALSKRPLQDPVVSCALGKLYNKDALIEFLLDKSAYGDGDEICGHVRSLKDVRTLRLTPRSPALSSDADTAQFVCPFNQKEMNGAYPFMYLRACGCVFSHAGFRDVTRSSPKDTAADGDELDVCPQCATKFSRSDVLTINPSREEESRMRAAMDLGRAQEPVKPRTKKRKAGREGGVEDTSVLKKKKEISNTHSPSPAPGSSPSVSATSKALMAEEAKRKAGMSDVVRSLYRSRFDQPRKETFTTMGTFTRYA